jgi:hypothetical protein
VKPMGQYLLATFFTVALMQSAQSEPEEQVSWREQYAYSVGMAAYPYTLPYLFNSQLRWMWTNLKRDPERSPYAAINHFYHAPKLTDASYRDGGGPNNDTVYSEAWIYVGDEPIIFSHPDMGDRNFSFHFTSYSSDLIDVVSQRATGAGAGHFAMVPPGFEGELPAGVRRLITATTPWILVVGRTMVDGKQDMPNVAALQQQLRLTPLSYWGKPVDTLPASHDVWAPYKAKQDPLASWRTINRAMTENPPPGSEVALLNFLAQVHIGPGQDLDTLDDDSKRGLARAARDGHKMAIRARSDLPGGTTVNGWRRSPDATGSMGQAGLYFERGIMQSFKGISPNFPAEGRYFNRSKSAEGELMDASQANYRLTFPAGKLPPVDAFWSITMYGLDANLVDNPLDRYSLGDRSADLKYGADGSLTLYLQHESPGKGKESNWLPAPDGIFYVSIRTYRPREEITNGSWVPENIETLKK